MRCPFCFCDDDKVIETRSARNQTSVRRRRECTACHRRFTTYESVELNPLRVVKRNGGREAYDPEKLRHGVRTACVKLPIPSSEVDALVSRVEVQLHNALGGEVSSEEIGDLVLRELAGLDPVAYIRFASVYRRYQDLQKFLDEVRVLLKST
ncbi:MAG: transcriptional regulator NrdR [Gemmatimonadetes bacterium]|nr:transcriptional regulator NrdR [Gemmatimonadota bacterium]